MQKRGRIAKQKRKIKTTISARYSAKELTLEGLKLINGGELRKHSLSFKLFLRDSKASLVSIGIYFFKPCL